MSDIIGGDQTPTPDELRRLKAALPQLKKKAKEQAEKKGGRRRTEIERMVDPMPCPICAVVFDAYGKPKDEKEFCSSCTTNLKAGQVCLLTKVSGKFAFMERKADGALDGILKKISVSADDVKTAELAQMLGGSIVHVPDWFMDKLQAKFQELQDKAKEN